MGRAGQTSMAEQDTAWPSHWPRGPGRRVPLWIYDDSNL